MTNRPRSIKCLNNNTVYKSIKEASEKLNVAKSGISNVLYGRIKATKGLTFEFVEGAELRLALSEVGSLKKQVTALEQDKIDLKEKITELEKRPVKIITDTHRSKIELANLVNFLKRKNKEQREKIEVLQGQVNKYSKQAVISEYHKKKNIIKEMEYNGERYD